MNMNTRVKLDLLFTVIVTVVSIVFLGDALTDFNTHKSTTEFSKKLEQVIQVSQKEVSPFSNVNKDHAHKNKCAHAVKSHNNESALSARPINHHLLPKEFEAALSEGVAFGSEEKKFPFNPGILDELKETQLGEHVEIQLTNELTVKGVVKNLKTYSSSPDSVKGMVELTEQNAHLNFFTSDEGATAKILFNEKSKALIYEETTKGSMFVEKMVSDLFCSDPGMIYPLDHPSNT